ncbi:MAG: arsenite methyltransferase [Heliobacteriaceae bacterium]|nr:arsenite methyltransferase [Heliobacteriaceae bacterium]
MGDDIRDQVREKYAQAIVDISSGSGDCCGNGCCCGPAGKSVITKDLYRIDEIDGLPAETLATSFGCGNPTALTTLHPGETVLDLGSGAGLDVLLSARRVGPAGKVYGLDMTDEMLAKARANQNQAGVTNVEFLQGFIEDIPLPDNHVDVVISNCVINLSGDKDKVMAEIFRVLKPGGRVAVSDVVLLRPLPDKVRQDLVAWTACVGGALSRDDYIAKLGAAGFVRIGVEVTRVYDFSPAEAAAIFPDLPVAERLVINGAVAGAFIRAEKSR